MSELVASVLDPAGSEARRIAGAWWLMFGLAAGVYAVVAGLILWGALRGRRTPSGRPSGVSDITFIWVGGVLGPAVVLLVLAVVTVDATAGLRRPERLAGALRIDVEAADWWWAVRYPREGITTANEIHVPVGRPVDVELTSRDVIHSFWVPELAGKLDAVPGQPNTLRFTAERPGVYRGACAEYCGLQHARMRFVVVAETPADFERWLARRRAPPGEPASELAARGRQVFEREACAGCHSIRGTRAQGTLGPDLSDLGARRTIGAGTVVHTRGNLAGWIANSQSLKPGNLMPPVTLAPQDLLAVVEYLESLK